MMTHRPNASAAVLGGGLPFRALLILCPVIFAAAIYANLSLAVKDPADLRFFPPFRPYVNANANGNMGGEYHKIARALAAGKGFANPFGPPTGPTAWQPPVYSLLLAGLLWLFDGSLDAVMACRVFLQVYVLIATGLLVVALAKATTGKWGAGLALAIYLGVLLWNFKLCFQSTLDTGVVLPALDVLIAGLCWFRPLGTWKAACGWGLFGGLCALINPIVACAWGTLTLWSGIKQRAWSRLVPAMLCAGLAMTPWTIRNYLTFGRLIPVKSNLAFELYQSQCLQPTGLLTRFIGHPNRGNNQEAQEYASLGETAYLDLKWQQFLSSVAADPADFADRVAARFLGATLWHVPFGETGRPWVVWLKRVTHAAPFLALVLLIFTSLWRPLQPAQWTVIGVYVLYLFPYIAISYYERYALPLVGVKVLFVIWAADRLRVLSPFSTGCKDSMSKPCDCRGLS